MSVREVVFDGEDVVAFVRKGNGTKAVITFQSWLDTPLGDRPMGDVKGFGEGAFVARGVSEFHIVGRRNHWYQTPEMEDVVRLARRSIEGRTAVAYGSSMGGHGAIAYGGVLGIPSFAFVPQFSIDRSVASFETRWSSEAAAIPAFDNTLIGSHCQGVFFFDPMVRLDRLQARLISERTGCAAVACPFSGHSTPAHIASLMPLQGLFLDFLNGDFDAVKFQERRRRGRLSDTTYLTNLSISFGRRGRLDCADSLDERAEALGKRVLRDYLQLFTDAWETGKTERAIRFATTAGQQPRNTVGDYVILISISLRMRDQDSVQELLAEARDRFPGNAALANLALRARQSFGQLAEIG